MPTVKNSISVVLTADVYVFPRYAVVPKHTPKAFIPRTHVLKSGRVPPTPPGTSPLPEAPATPGQHELVQGIITKLERNSVTVLRANDKGLYDDVKDDGSDAPEDRFLTIPFDYAVYALGAGLPPPSDVWGEQGRQQKPGRGTKVGGMKWLAEYGEEIKKAKSVLVVGGGALGIREFRTVIHIMLIAEFATDIKDLYNDKEVTLLHSRTRLLPIYHQSMHDAIVARCEDMGIKTVLGERVMQWPESPDTYDGKLKTVRTDKGSDVSAELVLVCTGTRPHIELLASLEPDAIAPNGCINVRPTMQVDVKRSHQDDDDKLSEAVSKLNLNPSLDHIFAVGDCADVKCIRAGHNSFAMGAVAARNIVRLVHGSGELEDYEAGPDRIKVSLGLVSCINQRRS